MLEEYDEPAESHHEFMLPLPWRSAPQGSSYNLAITGTNNPSSFEQFLMNDGEKKVEMKLDTRMR